MKIMKMVLILALLATLMSCGDGIKLCGDENFSMSREENNTDKLHLDGYYYTYVQNNVEDNPIVCLLYQSGIYYNCESIKLIDIPKAFDVLQHDKIRQKYKARWGIYKIQNNIIEIEQWVPRQCGGVSVVYKRGNIINDTTFNLNYYKTIQGGKVKEEGSLNLTFKFKPYSPKPDSIVSFIP